MNKIWYYFIFLIIILLIIELKNKKENFISSHNDMYNSNYTNLHKTSNLEVIDKTNGYIKIVSSVPTIYNIGIETGNTIDVKIAKYFKNNIIPANIVIGNNLIKMVNDNKLDLAFVREYDLLKSKFNNNIDVVMPTFNKYILCLTSMNNDIEFLEQMTELQDANNDKSVIRVCYINKEDLSIVKSLIELQKISKRVKNNVEYIKIDNLEEMQEKDIFIGLIYPENIANSIENLRLKPLFYIPRNRVPLVNLSGRKINEDDVDDIREFHQDFKAEYDWLMKAEIFPSSESEAYRTYKTRFLLICNKNSRITEDNFKVLINNWFEHRFLLKNIYQVDPQKRRGYAMIKDSFTDLASIPKELTINPTMKQFLENKKLIQ